MGRTALHGARPPASSAVPTLGVAVVAVHANGPATDLDPWEATRVSLLAAVDAVGASRTVLAGPVELQDLAIEFGVGFAVSDGSWDDGLRRALSIAPAELLALAPHDAVVVAPHLRGAVSELGADEAWLAAPVWGGATGASPSDGWIGPGCVVRTSVALHAMHDRDSAGAAWSMRADGWSCRAASAPVMAAQGDLPPSIAERDAVASGAAVLRATTRRSSPLWDGSCPGSVRLGAARAAARQVVGLATAMFVVLVSSVVALGRVPSPGPFGVVVLIASAGLLGASGASSIDTSVRTVGRAIVGGSAAPRPRRRLRVGRTAVLDRPVAVALTLGLEASLIIRAAVLQLVPSRSAAEHRADVVALTVGVAVLAPLLVSLRVIVRARPRRTSTRVPMTLPVRIDGRTGTVTDIGARGLAAVLDEAPVVGGRVSVVLGGSVYVPAVVVRVAAAPAGSAGRYVLGLRVVVSPPTEGTMAFQRMWVEHTAAVVRERSPWELAEQVTGRQGSRSIRIASAVTAAVVALAVAPPYPVSAGAAGLEHAAHAAGTRSALPFAADPEIGAPGRATPVGTIHH